MLGSQLARGVQVAPGAQRIRAANWDDDGVQALRAELLLQLLPQRLRALARCGLRPCCSWPSAGAACRLTTLPCWTYSSLVTCHQARLSGVAKACRGCTKASPQHGLGWPGQSCAACGRDRRAGVEKPGQHLVDVGSNQAFQHQVAGEARVLVSKVVGVAQDEVALQACVPAAGPQRLLEASLGGLHAACQACQGAGTQVTGWAQQILCNSTCLAATAVALQ